MPLFPSYSGPSLIEAVCSVENLTLAWRRVRSNIQVARRGRSAGVDAVTLQDFEADWSNQMAQLADGLRNGTYRPLPARRVSIPKASGGERAIAILAVRDRIAQRAVQQVLEPLFDPLFLDCSYGCRPFVGVPAAIDRLTRYTNQGLTWVVDADIATYFDTINQRLLLSMVRQRVNDVAILRLIQQWLDAGTLHDAAPFVAYARTYGQRIVERGTDAIHQFLHGEPEGYPNPALSDIGDPYAAAAWEQPYAGPPSRSWQQSGWPAPRQRQNQHIWTALALAKPAFEGARRALPYARRIGGGRLATAGAVAAGAVAAGGYAAHWMGNRERRGTPQGGSLSPLLANIYLHPFDVALTSQGLRVVRFVDDFVVLCTSEQEAQRALLLVERQLATLQLTLNAEKTRVCNYNDGIEFLGHALAPRRSGPRFEDGVRTFAQAEQKLRRTATRVRRKQGKGAAHGNTVRARTGRDRSQER